MNKKKSKQNNISASEVNKFTYCPYQWYYERIYGRKFILDRRKENKKSGSNISRNKSTNIKKELDDNFLRGNRFHREFRKEYMRARMKKIILFLSSVTVSLLGYMFLKRYFLIFLAIVVFVKFFFIHSVKKCEVKLPFWPWFLVYSDEKIGDGKKNITHSKTLVSRKHNLSGKPDMIYKNIFTQALIPIELKSGTIGVKKKPRTGDLLQLVSYFIILKECLKKKPRYGFLIYSDYMFIVPNKRKLRNMVIETLKSMNLLLKSGPDPSLFPYQKDYSVCKNCICNNSVCKQ